MASLQVTKGPLSLRIRLRLSRGVRGGAEFVRQFPESHIRQGQTRWIRRWSGGASRRSARTRQSSKTLLPERYLSLAKTARANWAERRQKVPLHVMGKLPADAVFLHRGVVGFDPHTVTMLTGTHRYDLRQAALHGFGWDQAEFLFWSAGDKCSEETVCGERAE